MAPTSSPSAGLIDAVGAHADVGVGAGAGVCFGSGLVNRGGGGSVGHGAVRAPTRAVLDGTQRCGRHPRTRSPSAQCACFGEQTATGPGSSAYTSRTALLTKRRAVRSTNHLITKRA
jgi:hypothetical protein